MSANADWKAELKAIIDAHNGRHGQRDKVVSHRTMQARAQGLFRCFALLREMGYQLAPAGLGGRHVAALVARWCEPARPLSAAYIQQQLSFLRVFGGWIGKPGLVLPARHYVAEPALVARSYTAEFDHGWGAAGVDAGRVLELVGRRDARVAAQLALMLAFGLRRKEAVMFRPHAAEVPAWALPASEPAGQAFVSFLRVKRGTKGGRLRYAAVRNAAQREALARARELVPAADGHLGQPRLTLRQALDRFSNVVRAAGVARAALGVTAHGLRHQFAGDLYYDIAQLAAPVRGGAPEADPEVVRAAYLEVARQLGHARPQISNAYLGSPVRGAAPGAQD